MHGSRSRLALLPVTSRDLPGRPRTTRRASRLAAVAVIAAGMGAAGLSAPQALAHSTVPGAIVIRTGRIVSHMAGMMGPRTALTTAAGWTLYYQKGEPALAITCTRTCTRVWHPLTTLAGRVSPPVGVHGRFTIMTGPDGRQVAYNDHPLFTYAGDTGPRESRGCGLAHGRWMAATPGLARPASAGPTPAGVPGMT